MLGMWQAKEPDTARNPSLRPLRGHTTAQYRNFVKHVGPIVFSRPCIYQRTS